MTSGPPTTEPTAQAMHLSLPQQLDGRAYAQGTEDWVPDPESEEGAGLEAGEEAVRAESRDQ